MLSSCANLPSNRGYCWFLVSVDEFSNYLIIVGLKSKHKGQIEKALKTKSSLCNSQGRRVVLLSLTLCTNTYLITLRASLT